MSVAVAPPMGLGSLLDARGDSMAVCRSVPWLTEFAEVPDDAAAPLAMSGAHPRAVGSYGAKCIAWAETELKIRLRWWQRLAITRQLEHDADGALVWREVLESGPRRIGKSVRLRVVALWRLANAERIGESQLTMLVSKDLAIGKEIHRGAWLWAERRGWSVTRLNGGQEIATPDEDRWLLRAPNAVYGYDVGYGQVDEAWSVDPTAITDGLEPAMLERLWAQLHLTSTAHVKASSLMRRRLLSGLRGADPDGLLVLWGAGPDADFSLVETWRSASPHWSADREALIRRKYAAAAAGEADPELDDPDPVRGWASQYLNIWPALADGAKASIMPAWSGRTARQEFPEAPAAIGVAVSMDREWASIAAAAVVEVESREDPEAEPSDGVFVAPVDRRAGVRWLVEELRRIQSENPDLVVLLDEGGPAADLLDDFLDGDVGVETVTLSEYAEACSRLYDGVRDGTVLHPAAGELDAAVEGAEWRNVGERRVWGRRKSAGDVSMLEAATLAAFGAEKFGSAPGVY